MKFSPSLLPFFLLMAATSAFAPVSRVLAYNSRPHQQPQQHAVVAHMRFPRLPFLSRNKESATAVLEEQSAGLDERNTAEVAAVVTNATTVGERNGDLKEEMTETQMLMKQVKDSGVAGVISYASWELAFWAVSVPVVLVGYYEVTGHWPDLSDKADIAKLSAEAFAFVNFARFAVPLRIGLALSTTPWVQENIVNRFMKSDDDNKQINGGETNGTS